MRFTFISVKASRIVTLACLVLCIGAAGFLAGRLAGFQTLKPNKNAGNGSSFSKKESGINGHFSETHKIYEVAHTSVGPLQKILNIKLVPIDDRHMQARLGVKEAAAVKMNMRVNLYRDADYPHSKTGMVTSILRPKESDTGEEAIIAVTLPDNIKSSDVAMDAGIILNESRSAKRLPVSTQVMADSENPFIWKAAPMKDDVYKIEKTNFLPLLQNERFFDVGHFIRNTDLIIIHPDDEMEEGQEIRIILKEIDAPTVTPNMRGLQLDVQKRKKLRAQKKQEIRRKLEAIQSESGSCTLPPVLFQDGEIILPLEN